MTIKNFWFLLLSLSFLNSCALIFKPTKEEVKVATDPPGARMIVNGDTIGKTPATLYLKPDKPYNIEFFKAGYADTIEVVNNSWDYFWLILDLPIFLGGSVYTGPSGMADMYNTLDTDTVGIKMRKVE